MRSLAPVSTEAEPVAVIAPEAAPADEASSAPMESEALPARRSRAVTVATLLSVVWLAAAAAAVYLVVRFQPPADLTLTGLAAIAAGVTAPLTAIWLIALVVGRASTDERQQTLARRRAAEARIADVATRTRHELSAIDGVLAAVADRVETIRGSMGAQTSQMMESAGRLEERSRTIAASLSQDREAIEVLLDRLSAGGAHARSELAAVMAALPQAEAQALAIGAALATGAGDARRQLGDIDALVAASRTQGDAARTAVEAAAERLTQAIAAIDAAGSEAAGRLTARTAALTEGADSALLRTSEAAESTRRGIDVQVAAIRASTEQARIVLQGFAGETSRKVVERFTMAAEQAERLTRAMAEQEDRSQALVDKVERGFGVLDAKLANAAQSSGSVLDRLAGRLTSVRDQMHDLATPLGGSQAATRELEAAVAALRATAAESVELLSTALPQHVGDTAQAVETVRHAVAALSADIATLRGRASDAVAPVEQGRSTIEAMTRVREVASQAEGTMRTALAGVVSEAREAVAAASQEAMHDNFTKRVRVEIAEVEAVGEKVAQAAQATAERLSRQMISVAETAAAVEARIAQTETRLDEASQGDLSRRAGLMIEALNSESIDIAKALSTEVTDTAWASYLKGDRGIFTRRAVRLLDGGDARSIARRYNEDVEFRESVSRYIQDFEGLMRRTLAERDGGSLSVALLSSDIGKLYVALAQAVERIRS